MGNSNLFWRMAIVELFAVNIEVLGIIFHVELYVCKHTLNYLALFEQLDIKTS